MLIISVIPIFGLGTPSAEWMHIFLFLWLDVFFEGLVSVLAVRIRIEAVVVST